MSSKSRAASHPILATSSEKSRIVEPNVGTARNLWYIVIISTMAYIQANDLPFIKLHNRMMAADMKQPNKVFKNSFPYAKFNLMELIDNQCGKYVEFVSQASRECILNI
jgi:hypothetical protein